MHILDDKEKLFALLAQGATVITPNNRLSSVLLQEYFDYFNGKTIDRPHCLPYSMFLINSFQQLKWIKSEVSFPTLLNKAQCQHLWRKILKSSSQITYSEGLLQAV